MLYTRQPTCTFWPKTSWAMLEAQWWRGVGSEGVARAERLPEELAVGTLTSWGSWGSRPPVAADPNWALCRQLNTSPKTCAHTHSQTFSQLSRLHLRKFQTCCITYLSCSVVVY